jgi:hypothetical protein
MNLVAVNDHSLWFQVESPLVVEKSVWARAGKRRSRSRATTARVSSDGVEDLIFWEQGPCDLLRRRVFHPQACRAPARSVHGFWYKYLFTFGRKCHSSRAPQSTCALADKFQTLSPLPPVSSNLDADQGAKGDI